MRNIQGRLFSSVCNVVVQPDAFPARGMWVRFQLQLFCWIGFVHLGWGPFGGPPAAISSCTYALWLGASCQTGSYPGFTYGWDHVREPVIVCLLAFSYGELSQKVIIYHVENTTVQIRAVLRELSLVIWTIWFSLSKRGRNPHEQNSNFQDLRRKSGEWSLF